MTLWFFAIAIALYFNIGAATSAKIIVSVLEGKKITVLKTILLIIFLPFTVLIALLLLLLTIVIWIIDLFKKFNKGD